MTKQIDNRTLTSAKNGLAGGRPANNFFIVPAPGHYGDSARVYSSHKTLDAAKKACGRGCVVRVGEMRKGAKWLRAYEEIHLVA